jgi:outer membrane receptor protein involved in Fe transport
LRQSDIARERRPAWVAYLLLAAAGRTDTQKQPSRPSFPHDIERPDMPVRTHTARRFGLTLIALAAATVAQAQVSETIVITGSRLVRDINATAPAPVATVSAEELRAAGNTDISATLREIPALLASGTVADSLERGAGGVGQAVLNLRQLGANRTLVLIDGRRHVSGVAGSSAVDVSTIPAALLERVEVMTGGASAIYGADAVTGVINYVQKRDFTGLELEAQTGISGERDGQADSISVTYGMRLNERRGNIAFSAGYTNEREVLLGDRSFTRDNGRANNSTTYQNPARRFQKGDIDPTTMPNFAGYYRVGGPGPRTTRIAFGPPIPTAAQFATQFPGQTPTAAEQALMDRAANAPLRVIQAQPVFAISSTAGLIFRADFDFFNADINNNGINDCNESFVGWTGFGGGGCYVSTPDGGVKIFEDGLISTAQNQFGGDGAVERTNATSLTPGSERFHAAVIGQYDFSPALELYWDAKVVRSTTVSRNSYNTFFDTAYIAPDNPWIPTALQADANDAGGLLVSRDNIDFGPGKSTAKRDTYRLVTGLRGELGDSHTYDLTANIGRTNISNTFSNAVLADRFMAAIDAVRAPDGTIVCRSDLDPSAIPDPPFLPEIDTGFFTFKPGDGQCRPANLFRGSFSVSPESVAFFTRPSTDTFRLDQQVLTLTVTGDSGNWFNLPGGAIQYAVGAEHRREKSKTTLSNEDLGILDDGSFIGDVSGNVNLLFNDQVRVFNAGGKFSVSEVFAETRLPLLKGRPFAHELGIDAAVRFANYSTIGNATTWNLAPSWSPTPDFKLRGSYSKAIRAPDIFELFSPQQAATFRPSDPCSISDLNQRIANNLPNAETRKANCATALTALGIDPNTYEDPLTARFAGTSGGNPNLSEESATTWTAGFVITPRALPGFSLSLDYYSIEIQDAIAAVTAQNIVNSCYDLATFPNQFCGLFDRRTDNGGFASLRQVQVNFGRIETTGADLDMKYQLRLGGDRINLGLKLNYIEKLNRFFDPVRTDLVNPAKGELSVPEWSGVLSAAWTRSNITVGWRGQYIGEQGVASAVQIEDVAVEFGPAGIAPAMWVHNLSASWQYSKNITVAGGVNNLTNEKPYRASSAYPVSGVGRTFFAGVRAKF